MTAVPENLQDWFAISSLKGGTVIAGGASNIGRAVVHAFALAGCQKLVIIDLDVQKAEAVLREAKAIYRETHPQFNDANLNFKAYQSDLTQRQQLETTIDMVVHEYGTISVCVNSVGWVKDNLFSKKPYSEWEKEININLWAVINLMRVVLPVMVKGGGGSVVNIASDAGRIGEYQEAVYSATKGGVIALSKALAREYGRFNIRLNCVCPGLTLPEGDDATSAHSLWTSEMKEMFNASAIERAKKAYPLRRLGRPQDTANAVLFLASNAANFITGQTLSVSGGYSMM